MTEIKQKKCDNKGCGSVTDLKKVEKNIVNTPHNWIRITVLDMKYRTPNSKIWSIPKKNRINIDESNDPDFCCKKCAMEWFEAQLDMIMRKAKK